MLFSIRLIHTFTGIGWLGEVAEITFVLVPALVRAEVVAVSLMIAAAHL